MAAAERERIPWRTILATIGLVLATLAALQVLGHLTRLIAWLLVAGFFAVILDPAVRAAQRRLRLRRGVAAAAVFLTVVVLVAGFFAALLVPIVDQSRQFADDLPSLLEDARNGEGAIGEIVDRFDLENSLDDVEADIRTFVSGIGRQVPGILAGVFNTIYAALTIIVLTVLLLVQGPNLVAGAKNVLPDRHRDRVGFVAHDMARSMSAYMYGNFLISIVAGVASYVFLRLAGVPYPEVLALWVAFTDLIPLVGATIGAVPTAALAFIHSTTAGIAATIFFIAYQQFENHVLQVTVMARTVKVNPLTVLVSVIAGIEIFGYVGALLAIPAAGAIQVVIRDVFDERLRLRRPVTAPDGPG